MSCCRCAADEFPWVVRSSLYHVLAWLSLVIFPRPSRRIHCHVGLALFSNCSSPCLVSGAANWSVATPAIQLHAVSAVCSLYKRPQSKYYTLSRRGVLKPSSAVRWAYTVRVDMGLFGKSKKKDPKKVVSTSALILWKEQSLKILVLQIKVMDRWCRPRPKVITGVCDFVCVGLCPHFKRNSLSCQHQTPYTYAAVALHALTRRSKDQKSRSHGRMQVAAVAVVLLLPAYDSTSYDCFGF